MHTLFKWVSYIIAPVWAILLLLPGCNTLAKKGDPKEWESFLAKKPDTVFIPLSAPEGRASLLDTIAYGIWDDAIFVQKNKRWIRYYQDVWTVDIKRYEQIPYRDSLVGDSIYLIDKDDSWRSDFLLVHDTVLYQLFKNKPPLQLKKYRYIAQKEMEYFFVLREEAMHYNTLGSWTAYMYNAALNEVLKREYRLYWQDTSLLMRAGIRTIAVKPEVVGEGLKLSPIQPLTIADPLDVDYWLVTHDKQVMKEYHNKAALAEANTELKKIRTKLNEDDRSFLPTTLEEQTRKQDMKKPCIAIVWE